MGRFGRRNDTFGAGEEYAGSHRVELSHRTGFDQLVLEQLADDRTSSVIAQTACMYVCRMEVVAQGVHRQQRRETGYIAEIVLECSTGQFGTGLRLDGYYAGLAAGG